MSEEIGVEELGDCLTAGARTYRAAYLFCMSLTFIV